MTRFIWESKHGLFQHWGPHSNLMQEWPPLQPGNTAVAPAFSMYSHFLPLRAVPLEGDKLFSPTQTSIHCSRSLSGKHIMLHHSTVYPSSPVELHKHLYLPFHANGLFFPSQHSLMGFLPFVILIIFCLFQWPTTALKLLSAPLPNVPAPWVTVCVAESNGFPQLMFFIQWSQIECKHSFRGTCTYPHIHKILHTT